MSNQQEKEVKPVSLTTMIFGTIIFIVSLAAWLYASERDMPTEIIWVVAIPVITALFIGESLAGTARNAAKTVEQTNGAMGARIESAVAKALGNRDAARTRQARGDKDTPMTVEITALPEGVTVDDDKRSA